MTTATEPTNTRRPGPPPSNAIDQSRRLRRLARILRYVNVPMRALLSLPFATPLSGNLMLVEFEGRKTGMHYRQPVSYVPDGDELLTPGGGRWKVNLVDGEPVRLRYRGRAIIARPQFVRDPDLVASLVTTMMAKNPRVASFVPFVTSDRRIDRAGLETAVAYGFAVIRWQLETQ